MKRIPLLLLCLCSLWAQAQQLVIFDSNTENLIDTYDDYESKIATLATVMNEYGADIYCLQEVQPTYSTVNKLMDALNAKSSYNYVAINLFDNSSYYHQSLYIYNAAKVEPVGDGTSPYSSGLYNMRLRIQEFEDLQTGEKFLLSNNHFKSYNESKTLENAEKLVTKLSSQSQGRVVIVGDLNSELTDDPCQCLVNAGYIEEVESRYPNGHSYYYGGRYTYIDHCFTSSQMHEYVQDAKALSINLGSNAKYGYSDHEPLLITLNFNGGGTEPEPEDTTQEDPIIVPTGILTVSEAYDYAAALSNKEISSYLCDVRGTVSDISEVSTTYGNITFDIEDANKTIRVYRSRGLDSLSVTDENLLALDDTVVVRGYLENYNGTMEMVKGYIREIHSPVDAISAPNTEYPIPNAPVYNLQGQATRPNHHGLYILRTRQGIRKVLK